MNDATSAGGIITSSGLGVEVASTTLSALALWATLTLAAVGLYVSIAPNFLRHQRDLRARFRSTIEDMKELSFDLQTTASDFSDHGGGNQTTGGAVTDHWRPDPADRVSRRRWDAAHLLAGIYSNQLYGLIREGLRSPGGRVIRRLILHLEAMLSDVYLEGTEIALEHNPSLPEQIAARRVEDCQTLREFIDILHSATISMDNGNLWLFHLSGFEEFSIGGSLKRRLRALHD